MKWPWGSLFNEDQRKETAKLLLRIAEIVILGILATPFLPEVSQWLTLSDRMYGILLAGSFYILAMRLLRK